MVKKELQTYREIGKELQDHYESTISKRSYSEIGEIIINLVEEVERLGHWFTKYHNE